MRTVPLSPKKTANRETVKIFFISLACFPERIPVVVMLTLLLMVVMMMMTMLMAVMVKMVMMKDNKSFIIF